MAYEDILLEKKDGIARITIDRPQVMNAFRGRTCKELIEAFGDAGWDKSIGVIVLGGVGGRAFCTGGDQSAHEGHYDGRGTIAKSSFNASTEAIRGIGSLGFQALSLYYQTEESREGVRAFLEKRKPEFRKQAK